MLENAAESHTSGARFVCRFCQPLSAFYFETKIIIKAIINYKEKFALICRIL